VGVGPWYYPRVRLAERAFGAVAAQSVQEGTYRDGQGVRRRLLQAYDLVLNHLRE
jgi:hypothetical protein